MEQIKITSSIVFIKVKFEEKPWNRGRCLTCEGRNFCGTDFKCPCADDEQLNVVKADILTE